MKRVSLPLLGVLAMTLLATGEIAHRGAANRAPERRIASVGLYKTVVSDWTNIPSLCKEDFPLTEYQKNECDRFWRDVLSRAMLAIFPFFLTFLVYKLWSHSVTRTYQRAASRISRRRVQAFGEVVGEAPEDFYSWLHGFRPMKVKTGEKELVVYLEKHAEKGAALHLFEAGRWFRSKPLVGIVLKP